MHLSTRLTRLLKIELPIMSAGMAGVAGPELVAAVSNAGGIGTLGAIGMSPEVLRENIRAARSLMDPGRPLGVDLLLPKLGEGARATNKDYTGGQLSSLLDVMIEESIELFVSAVGVPPRPVVERLHEAGILVMNMVGSPRHVPHCVRAGVDIVCAQGTEAGGHTGDISTLVLLPQVVDLCREHGILVVGAGGISDGRGIAACLALGAEGVWMGSRFIMTEEGNAQPQVKRAIQGARSEDTLRTEIYTGRPARMLKNPYILDWELERQEEKRKLLQRGVVPFYQDHRAGKLGPTARDPIPRVFEDVRQEPDEAMDLRASAVAVGQVCGTLSSVQPAAEVIGELMASLRETLERLGGLEEEGGS